MSSFHAYPRTTGFTLVEIMVGMVIGMLGIIIMMQVFSQAEGTKRATTSGGDTTSTGAIAIYGLQRDIRAAGYGASDAKILGCDLQLRAGVTMNVLAPVTINHGSIPAGDANTDTLLVVYGNVNGSPQGDGISSQGATARYTMQTPTAFAASDRVIAIAKVRPAPCSLILDSVASIGTPSAQDVNVTTGVASISGGYVFNMGQSPKVIAYAVRGGNLTMCKWVDIDLSSAPPHTDNGKDCTSAGLVSDATVWVPIANNVVSMRAQYAKDSNAPMDGLIDTFDQTALASACAVAKVQAIRLALVVRAANLERTTVTASAPTWEGTSTTTLTGAPTNPTSVPINLTSTTVPAGYSWQNYRYRVFQTIVPIRNVSWLGAQTGC